MVGTIRKKSFVVSIALFVSTLMALSSWAVSSPVAASPDESVHLAGIWCANGIVAGQCEMAQDGRPIVPAKLNNWCYQHLENESAKCTSRIDIDEMIPIRSATEPNVFLKSLELLSGSEIATRVIAMRIATVSFLALMVAALFSLSDRRHRLAIVLTCGVIFVPAGIYFVSAIHPSGLAASFLLIFGISLSQITKLKLSKQKLPLKLIALSIASLLFSFQVRSEAFIFAIAIASIFLATTWFTESQLRLSSKLRLVLAATVVSGALISLLINYSSLPLTLNVWGAPLNPERSALNVAGTNFKKLPSMYLGNFGYWGLGALDVPLPMIVWSSVGIVFVGIMSINAMSSSRQNLNFGTFAVLFSAMLILSILQSSKLYVGEQMQPRYILPLLAMAFAIFIANGSMSMPDKVNFVYLSTISILLLSVANSLSLWTMLRRYTSGLDVGSANLNYKREWWWDFPIDPNQVWLLGTLSFTTALALGIYSVVLTKQYIPIQKMDKS